MGFFGNLFLNRYSPEDFVIIMHKHWDEMERRDLEKMNFMYGDKAKFIHNIEGFIRYFEQESKSESSNPKWYGHDAPDFLRDVIQRINQNRPVAWESYFSVFLDAVERGYITW